MTRECRNKIWAFETVPGYKIVEGFAHQLLKRITSRKDCEELCLQDGTCRAAEYNQISTTCSLTRYDRRRTPESFEKDVRSQRVVYLENQCRAGLHSWNSYLWSLNIVQFVLAKVVFKNLNIIFPTLFFLINAVGNVNLDYIFGDIFRITGGLQVWAKGGEASDVHRRSCARGFCGWV